MIEPSEPNLVILLQNLLLNELLGVDGVDFLVKKKGNRASYVHLVQIRRGDLPLNLVLHALEALFQLVSFDFSENKATVATVVFLRVRIEEIDDFRYIVATPTVLVCAFLWSSEKKRCKQIVPPNTSELPLRCSLELDTFGAVGKSKLAQNGRS